MRDDIERGDIPRNYAVPATVPARLFNVIGSRAELFSCHTLRESSKPYVYSPDNALGGKQNQRSNGKRNNAHNKNWNVCPPLGSFSKRLDNLLHTSPYEFTLGSLLGDPQNSLGHLLVCQWRRNGYEEVFCFTLFLRRFRHSILQ